MREIKFRAWDKDKNVLLKSSWRMLISMTGCITWLVDHYDGNLNLTEREETDGNDRFELMQYTGLKDKNGVEIYEGDIFKGWSGIYVVAWLPYDAGLYLVEANEWKEYQSGGESQVDVHTMNHERFNLHFFSMEGNGNIIGNIYEHPELIKEG